MLQRGGIAGVVRGAIAAAWLGFAVTFALLHLACETIRVSDSHARAWHGQEGAWHGERR